jgi:hypothetical protein
MRLATGFLYCKGVVDEGVSTCGRTGQRGDKGVSTLREFLGAKEAPFFDLVIANGG